MEGLIRLPVAHVDVEYSNKTAYIKKGSDFHIKLSEASSGFQSLVPMYVASSYMASSVKPENETARKMTPEQIERFALEMQSINETPGFTEEQKRIARSNIGRKFNKTAFINIVEEPEQNLFPASQRAMLYSLLEFNNMSSGNKLVMTTHSPYLINYMTVSIGAYNLLEKIRATGKTETLTEKVYDIIPKNHIVNPDDLVIYEMDEETGTIRLLGNYRGLPSDENKLNVELGFTNDEYSKLLEIEKLCR